MIRAIVRRALARAKVSRRANLDRYYLISTRWFSVFAHRVHHDEHVGIYHTHPWSWVSFVFGVYDDHRVALTGPWHRRVFGLNACRAGVPHRVTLVNGPVWTLCVHGPRRCQWAVYDAGGNVLEVEPWRGVEKPERKEYAP